MTGDGVNDASALAQTDVGIAIGAGSDVVVETGVIILNQSNSKDRYRSLKFPAMHTLVAEIVIATETEDVDSIIEIINKNRHIRDGIVFVTKIEQATRIRDGKQRADNN